MSNTTGSAGLVPAPAPSADLKRRIASPGTNKLASTSPILLGVDGESKALIEKYNAGVYFDPENKISFRRSLELIMDVDKYKLGCQKLANDYNRNNIAIKMLNKLKKTKNGI